MSTCNCNKLLKYNNIVYYFPDKFSNEVCHEENPKIISLIGKKDTINYLNKFKTYYMMKNKDNTFTPIPMERKDILDCKYNINDKKEILTSVNDVVDIHDSLSMFKIIDSKVQRESSFKIKLNCDDSITITPDKNVAECKRDFFVKSYEENHSIEIPEEHKLTIQNTNLHQYVFGRQTNLQKYGFYSSKLDSRFFVLKVDNWTSNLNDSFMQCAIDYAFLIKNTHDVYKKNIFFFPICIVCDDFYSEKDNVKIPEYNKDYMKTKITSREICQLRMKGMRFFVCKSNPGFIYCRNKDKVDSEKTKQFTENFLELRYNDKSLTM